MLDQIARLRLRQGPRKFSRAHTPAPTPPDRVAELWGGSPVGLNGAPPVPSRSCQCPSGFYAALS